jgi:hypothetical protein
MFIKPIIAVSIMALTLLAIRMAIPTPIVQLITGIFSGFIVYSILIYALLGKELKPYISLIGRSN